MSKPSQEILGRILEVHYRQLAECRQRNYVLTERTIAAILILTGFLVFGNSYHSTVIKLIAILGLLIGSFGVCVVLYTNNRAYLSNAKVVRNINNMLQLYDTSSEIEKPLYPSEWKTFGQKDVKEVCKPLWILIMSLAVIACLATLLV